MMLSTWLGIDKYKFYKSLVGINHRFERTISRMRVQCSTYSATLPSHSHTAGSECQEDEALLRVLTVSTPPIMHSVMLA